MKFCQDHLYKANFKKWVFTDETHFLLKNAGEKRWIKKRVFIFNQRQKQGIKGFAAMEHSVNIKVQYKLLILKRIWNQKYI